MEPLTINLLNKQINSLKGMKNNNPAKLDIICEISKLLIAKSDQDVKQIIQQVNPLADERADIQEVSTFLQKEDVDSTFIQTLENNARSVVMIVKKSDLSSSINNSGETIYEINAKPLNERKVVVGGKKVPYKSDLPISHRLTANSLGTGFFYEEKWIVTAAHVLFPPFLSIPLSEIRFIRGWDIEEDKEDVVGTPRRLFVKKSSVFKAVKTNLVPDLDYLLSSRGDDHAVIEVTPEDKSSIRDLSDHKWLDSKHLSPHSEYEELREGSKVYGLGHGLGMVLKLSPCGEIIKNEKASQFFYCQLDAFSGNSGTAIFDSRNHKLIGMLVRGKKDFFFPKDSGKSEVVPGVLAGPKSREECQKIDFLRNYSINKEVSYNLIEAEILKTPHRDILPYTRLEIDPYHKGLFHLYITVINENRKVIFSYIPNNHW